MEQYKLHYLNIRGRAELTRLLFAYAGQKYEDYRIKMRDWSKVKPTTPTGKVPILEINIGNNTVLTLCESRAIARYLSNKFGLTGKNDFEKAKADEIIDIIWDELDTMQRYNLEKDENIKAQGFEKLINEVIPFNLKYFENVLSNNKSGYIVGDSLTWADIALMSKWDILPGKESLLENYPLVRQHDEKIRNIPQISDWLQKRPVSKL